MARRPADDPDDDDDDRPRAKKSKKQRKQEQIAATNRKILIYGGSAGGVVVLALIVLAVVFWPKPAPKPTTPDQYVGYDSPEEVFHVSLPHGWKVQSGGKKNTAYVNAEKGGSAVKVYESLVGSLLGDIAGAGNPDPNAGDEFLPVSKVHETKKQMLAEEYAGYKEGPAVTVKTKFGKARQSEFTGREGLTKKVRGYRVTALGALTQITIVCTCSPDDWDALEPAFAKVIASVGPGSGGR